MWQEPKTDWEAGDYFNVADYNRIKGNLNALRELAISLYPSFEIEDMGADKNYSDYGFYADEINRFEANIDHIRSGTYPFSTGVRKTFYENQPFIDWKELNRIEGACLLIYNNLIGQREGRARLPYQLGRRREPRC